MTARRLLSLLIVFVAGLLPAAAFAVNVKVIDMGKSPQIWFVEDHTVPIIALTVSLPAGSAYDPAGKEGLAAFTASLLDEGAGKLNSDAYHTALAQKAIQLSASAGRDYTTISLVTLKENAADAYRLLGLALSKPRFDPDAIERVRAQILETLKEGDEDPSTVAARAFGRAFFAGHPYGHSVEGQPVSIMAIQRGDIQNFARAHCVRGGAKIAVSGDVDVATLKSLLTSAFNAIPTATPPPIAPVRHMGAPGLHVTAMPVPQPVALFGLPGILRNDKDFIPAYVANYILGGGGFSSRLMKDVREQRGLTYDISTDLATYQRAGLLAGQVATRNDAMKQTIQVLRDTMAKFASEGATAKELADAQTYLTGSFPLAFASNVGIAAQLNTFQRVGLPVDYLAKRNGLIQAVTLDDIKRVAQRLFNPSKLTVVVAGTPGECRPTASKKASAWQAGVAGFVPRGGSAIIDSSRNLAQTTRGATKSLAAGFHEACQA